MASGVTPARDGGSADDGPAGDGASDAAASGRDAPGAEPRAGSTLHYALLRVDGEPRARVLGRLALGRAIVDALLDVTDPGVARTKVHWWHEELDRLHAGAPRHPATTACADLAGDGAARALLLALLGAAAADRLEPAATIEALDAALGTIGGHRLALACDALVPGTGLLGAPDALPAGLGVGLMRHERLSRLPPLLARRHRVFSAELYRRHGLDAAGLLAGVRMARAEGDEASEAGAGGASTDDDAKAGARAALLRDAVGLAAAALETGLTESRSGSAVPVAARVFATLRLRQLELWRAKGTDLLRERRSLTPLRKAWIAARMR